MARSVRVLATVTDAPRITRTDLASTERPERDLPAFLALISSLSGRLAAASGDAIAREIDAGLGELLDFFGVEQCGILEIQPDMRQARLRHLAHVDGVTPVPSMIDYGAFFPWTHERSVMRGNLFVQTCIDDLPAEAATDRASALALNLQAIINLPVGVGGRVTHVLGLVSSRPVRGWPEPILAWLQMIAETFLAALARLKMERALETSERSLAEAQRIAGVGSYVRDWSTGTLIASEEANHIFGRTLGEGGGDPLDFVHPDDRARVEQLRAQAFHECRESSDLECRIVRVDGTTRDIRSRTETTYNPDGTPRRTLVTIQDVSALRAAEQESRRLRVELRHADRAAHIGELTASLSHELNQPLMGILANAQAGLRLIAQGRGAASELTEIFDSVVRDNKRAASVIANLRLLLRREEPPRGKLDVAEAIAEVLSLFKSEFEAKNIRLEAQLESGCSAMAIKTQIQQVMVNLLSNAVQALQDRAVQERWLGVDLSRVGDDHVEISVRDNGIGIADDRLPHIFEAFYTTKSDGLGMGLPIARSIIEAHGGEIIVETHAAGGTMFRLWLPVEPPIDTHKAVASRPGTGVPRRHAANADDTVCVVDDDPAIREGLARLLGATGFRVVSFDSGAAALAGSELATAQCLVLDVQMPVMSGTELQEEMTRRGITTPVIFLTARGDAATGVHAIKRGALEYLCKPVEDGVLIEAVRKAIEVHEERAHAAHERASIEERMARLTVRECDVLREVIAGRLNKQIADRLSISEATVKQHRGQVMEKLEIRSVADLVRLCQIAGFPTRSR